MKNLSRQIVLGVEGGATKTHWLLSHNGTILREGQLGCGSMKLLSEAQLRQILESLPREAERVGVFLAGCATADDRRQLHQIVQEIWPHAHVEVGSDRQSGFAAAFQDRDGIAVIAGTGSAVTGRFGEKESQAGGWGHLLGDTGGGYDLAVQGLRRVLFDFDTDEKITPLAEDTLRALGVSTLRELSTWAQQAEKRELAKLTPILFRHADTPAVQEILREGAEALAALTLSVARRLDFQTPSICPMGSVFTKQPLYQKLFTEAIQRHWPEARPSPCPVDGSYGALWLAGREHPVKRVSSPLNTREPALAQADTEKSNPRSVGLDRMSPSEIAHLFASEEREVEKALSLSADALGTAITMVTEAFQTGGRLFYIGAGTSGRLGFLDASEMPPTFGVPPTMVQAILAGGTQALQNAVEGAEDSRENGALSIRHRNVRPPDVVCGITASGRTPFVLGALAEARALGMATIFLTCNPHRDKSQAIADLEIDLATGPEIITGSTRLKAGTATKVALNTISSGAMVRLGKVDGNAMSCLRATNEKLQDRAARIVASQLGLTISEARILLECANWDIRAAIQTGRTSPAPNTSAQTLRS